MKLSEKIYACRKRCGLSQEALAEQVGVSRQAVSKWETSEAEPEIAKLKALAAAFGVTTDYLLSEEEEPPKDVPRGTDRPSWMENLPRMLGNLIRRFGWLAGLYFCFPGVLILAIGLSLLKQRRDMVAIFGPTGMADPLSTAGTWITGFGAVYIVGGIVLAIVLKKKLKK